jgi:hypothetical protein
MNYRWFDKKSESDLVNKTFNGLTKYFDDYIKNLPYHDLPYWYTERSLIGHLVRGAALNKFFTVEQYAAKEKPDSGKTTEESEENKTRYPDLYICNRNGSDDIVLESKRMAYYSINWGTPTAKKIQYYLHEAIDQGKKYSKNVQAKRFMAVVFIITKWSYGKNENNGPENEKIFLEKCNEFVDVIESFEITEQPNFIYRYFAPFKKIKPFKDKRSGNYYSYPGLVAIGKVSKWDTVFK